MADVFISYKRRMRPRVVEIAQALEALGVDVWFDAELEAGRSFGAVINAELQKAKCVIVCWTPDAFAPEDGSEVSWVEGEASIARERKVLVPVMLERTQLNAPWNMLHTERLADWTPGKPDAGWSNVVAAVGRLVGRPGLGDYVKLAGTGQPDAFAVWKRQWPDDPLARGDGAAPVAPTTRSAASAAMRRTADALAGGKAQRWLLGATIFNTLASIITMLRVGPEGQGIGEQFLLAGPILAGIVYAMALWRGGVLDLGRAVFTIFAVGVGYVASIVTEALVMPIVGIIGVAPGAMVGIVNGFLSGAMGVFLALGGIVLLIGRGDRRAWLGIVVGSIAVGIACAVISLGLFKAIYASNFFWIGWIWQLCFGLLLTAVAGRLARNPG